MEKMRMESENIQQENVAKIAALFPNCVTEARDEDGHLKKAVNFELLKQMLSPEIVEGGQKLMNLHGWERRRPLWRQTARSVRLCVR